MQKEGDSIFEKKNATALYISEKSYGLGKVHIFLNRFEKKMIEISVHNSFKLELRIVKSYPENDPLNFDSILTTTSPMAFESHLQCISLIMILPTKFKLLLGSKVYPLHNGKLLCYFF